MQVNMYDLYNVVYYLITILVITSAVNADCTGKEAHNIPKTMRAVGFDRYLPKSDANSLFDMVVQVPNIHSNEILIKVEAITVNPMDTRLRALNSNFEVVPKVLGFDGAGIVVDKGENVKLFTVGDEVIFMGDLRKNGSNAEYVALDEMLVAPKPKNLTFEEAAAMPLTSVTAYEALYDGLGLTTEDKGKSIFVIDSVGGVGSVATQLAKNLGLKVIGTASSMESETFTREHGADIVLNHAFNLIPQFEANGYSDGFHYILVDFDPHPFWKTLMKAIKPQGKICLVGDSGGLVDLKPLKDKNVTLVSEMMSTKIKYDTEDKYRHNEILQTVSKMLEDGSLKSTVTQVINPINAANLRIVHRLTEYSLTIGKIVLSGF